MNYPFPPALEDIRKRLESELGVSFNHVMLNRYDDGNIYIGYASQSGHKTSLIRRKHSDNLNNLVIASVSLGAERTFIMSPRMPSGMGMGKEEDGRKNIKWK
jgi:alkylated DNA repair dioxygenase AlkB